jgi:hypothetical protein
MIAAYLIRKRAIIMRFKYLIGIVLLLGSSSCNLLSATGGVQITSVPTEVPATPTLHGDPVEESGTEESPVETPTEVVLPTNPPPTPVPDVPQFSEPIAFSASPDPALRQYEFELGTEEIFAIWEYHNMAPGMIVRREWSFKGDVWISKEEEWDFAKYGASGMMTDISVYDYESGFGLEPGLYKLLLYIDGVPQFEDDGYASEHAFHVSTTTAVPPETSPDGTRQVLVDNYEYPATRTVNADPPYDVEVQVAEDTLVVVESDGTRRSVVKARDIRYVGWFPDNQHVLYTDYIANDPEGLLRGPMGRVWKLWVINVDTGEQHTLTTGEGEMHRAFAIAPDGKTIAVEDGTGYGDACFVDSALIFITLDDNYQRVGVVEAESFAGFNHQSESSPYPAYREGLPVPGMWEDATTFQTALGYSCVPGDNYDDVYRIDLVAQTVEVIAD